MANATYEFMDKFWDTSVLPTLRKYIEIPCKSVAFDPEWEKNGHIDRAMELIRGWCEAQNLYEMSLEIHRAPGRTPLMMIKIPGQSMHSILLYGHMDKQPEMSGWREGLEPWKAVMEDGRLYGRGGADDGYAVFAAISAIKALQEQMLPHPQCTILIEASEESGSCDLPFYMEQLKDDIPTPDLVICLDSGAGNYDQLWATTSLRGVVNGVLSVEVLTEGVHSGAASGIVPSSFRIIRQLLSRIEDENTGKVLLDSLYVDIPQTRIEEAKQVAEALGDEVWRHFPWAGNAKPADLPGYEWILNRSWRPAISYTGIGDMPAIKDAGNVLRPKTSLMLSLRIPPLLDHHVASSALKKALEADPPYGAKVSFDVQSVADGWNAPVATSWLLEMANKASETHYGRPVMYWGEGGSIPFMYLLGEEFPRAQFLVTGVLGPHANAHGPNEFLDIAMAKKLSCCVADILNHFFMMAHSPHTSALLKSPRRGS
jgi:acetylornithine deacetylase/succinyl-diaminopimelate desuccinylase-like protein